MKDFQRLLKEKWCCQQLNEMLYKLDLIDLFTNIAMDELLPKYWWNSYES